MKKIIITGGSEGIGFELAKALAAEGNQLTLVSRNAEKLEHAVKSLSGSGHDFRAADLSRKDEVHAVADLMSATHYDVLINCAGVGMYGRFEELPLDRQVAMMNLNMTALTVLSLRFIQTAKSGDALV